MTEITQDTASQDLFIVLAYRISSEITVCRGGISRHGNNREKNQENSHIGNNAKTMRTAKSIQVSL